MKSEKGIIHIAAVIFIALAAFFILGLLREARKGSPYSSAFNTIPANDHAKGLVYDGLEVNQDDCKGAFKVKDTAPAAGLRARCTHGPDPAPEGFDISKPVPPVGGTALKSSDTQVLGVTCDGDGVSGNRVQALYVRSSDVADRYAQYLTSFQQWAINTDTIFKNSAAETGGVRGVRYVHDGSCTPTVESVVLSPAGDDYFANTISELMNLGYNRTDRKYMVFMDAHVYCGIADISYDDRLTPDNMNNNGPMFGRVDNGCWNEIPAGHELGHTLGAVQVSAPHSSGEWHCWDTDDLMCRPTNGTPTQQLCPFVGNQRLDCNHDDYFSTNPAPGNYLYDHWNSANSKFLIGADPVPTIVSVTVGVFKRSKGNLITATTFKAGDSVTTRVNTQVSGVTVNYDVKDPNGKTVCSYTSTTDSNANTVNSCKTARTSVKGTWTVKVNSMSKSGSPYLPASGSVTEATFTLQ